MALGLSPLCNPRRKGDCKVPAFRSSCLGPGPPCSWPTPARARSAQASPRGTNHLGRVLANRSPCWARARWPGQGGLCLIFFRHQLRRLESQTAGRGPCSPLEWGQAPGFFPGKVHLRGPITPSLSPLPLYARHLASHQLSTGPKQTQQRQAGRSIPISPIPGALPGSTQRSDIHDSPTHPAAFIQRKVSEQPGMCPATAN